MDKLVLANLQNFFQSLQADYQFEAFEPEYDDDPRDSGPNYGGTTSSSSTGDSTTECNSRIEDCTDKSKINIYDDSDTTKPYGGEKASLHFFYYASALLAYFRFVVYKYEVQGKNTSLGPYTQYNFTCKYFFYQFGFMWALWLVNRLFDNNAGKFQTYFTQLYKMLYVSPILQFIFALSILVNYGSETQVTDGLRAIQRKNDNKFWLCWGPQFFFNVYGLYKLVQGTRKGVVKELTDAQYENKLERGGCRDEATGKWKQCSVADDQKKYGAKCIQGYTDDGDKCVDKDGNGIRDDYETTLAAYPML